MYGHMMHVTLVVSIGHVFLKMSVTPQYKTDNKFYSQNSMFCTLELKFQKTWINLLKNLILRFDALHFHQKSLYNEVILKFIKNKKKYKVF